MCGILLMLIQNGCETLEKEILHNELLKRRGPDIQNCEKILYANSQIIFYGSTLHLRGNYPHIQPLTLNGNKLLWNGEIFSGLMVNENENDGYILLKSLSFAVTENEIINIFASIKGPWAFIYYQTETNKIWFGRDIFGRRSLVYYFDYVEKVFIISSTAHKIASLKLSNNWVELPAIGIYCMNLNNFKTIIYPWFLPNIKESMPNEIFCDLPTLLNLLQFEYVVSNDGILCDFKFFEENGEDILYKNSANMEPSPSFKTYILNDKSTASNIPQNILMHETEERLKLVITFEHLLSEAVKVRINKCPKLCSNCIFLMLSNSQNPNIYSNENCFIDKIKDLNNINCEHSKCCILFSGGIDSLIIAALADRYILPEEPIDLLNVMFIKDAINIDIGLPSDRITSIEALCELKKIAPCRKWNLVQIDIEMEELQRLRTERIQQLIYPICSVLDDSIGCALWFASRGSGYIQDENLFKHPYTSPARVILSGLGADEQLAGYSRHRLRFKENGVAGVSDELKMELRRISSRNLGRDDRIISDHGREVRFPFLDEHVVQFLASLSIESKTDLSLERGVGDKLLLRIMAHNIGLVKGAIREKRAIQFGCGIVKLEKQKEKGSDICKRLQQPL